MITIPLNTAPSQELQIILNDQECTISVYQKLGSVFLDLIVGETDIQRGALCNNRLPIITAVTNDFEGNLYFVDTLGMSDPVADGVGDRYILLYATPEEVEEINDIILSQGS